MRVAEIAGAPGRRDRRVHRRRPRADIPSGCRCSPWWRRPRCRRWSCPRSRTKGSPSMIMRSAKVPLSPSSALQTMYLRSALVCATVFHLMPVGKPAPPRPRRPEVVTSARIASGVERQRALEALVAAMGAVILDRARIDHAAAREGQAGLPLQPGNLVGDAEPQRMRAVAGHRIEQRRRRRPRVTGPKATRPCGVATSTIGSSQYSPREPVRTISIGDAALGGGLLERQRDLVGADGDRAGIARNENAHASSLRLRHQRIEARFVEPADHAAVEHRRRRGGAQAEAIDRLQRHALVGAWYCRGRCRAWLRRARPAHRRRRPGRPRRGTASAHAGRPARGGNRGRR